ncbi:MAG TPA: transposase family protein [Kofleriaceae bacterium]|nr:transposase family protein [Kofleriaceae bacterium]
MRVLSAISTRRLALRLQRMPAECRRGRPRSRSRRDRLLITCAALRTNLTIRELAAVFAISKSTAHRIVAAITRRLSCLGDPVCADRRWSWIVDGTLIPTRDHTYAARAKNYRWSCNAQLLVRRRGLRVVAISAGGQAIATIRCTTEDR